MLFWRNFHSLMFCSWTQVLVIFFKFSPIFLDLLKILNKLENFRIKQRHEPFAEELDEPIERITDNFRSHLINALGGWLKKDLWRKKILDLQDLTKLMLKNEDLDFQEKIIFTETFCAQLYKRGGTYREGIKDVILVSIKGKRRTVELRFGNKDFGNVQKH